MKYLNFNSLNIHNYNDRLRTKNSINFFNIVKSKPDEMLCINNVFDNKLITIILYIIICMVIYYLFLDDYDYGRLKN